LRRLRAALLATVGLCILADVAGAANWLFDPANNNFNDNANWDPNTVPTGADLAIFQPTNISTLVFSANTAFGGIVFDSGAPLITLGNPLGLTQTINGNITGNTPGGGIFNNNGTLTLNNSTITGNVLINNSNNLTIQGSSLLGNDTTLNSTAGQVFVRNNASLGGARVDVSGGFLELTDNAIGGNSTITIDGNGNLFLSGQGNPGLNATLNINGNGQADFSASNRGPNGIQIGSLGGDGILRAGGNRLDIGSGIFSGNIADGGFNGGTGASLNKVGTGTLTLNGNNTYTGDTNVNGGTLIVNGNLTLSNSVIVGNDATLGGIGTLRHVIINQNGALAPGGPGNGIGTITIQNNLVFNPGSFIDIDVSPNNADRVIVNGNANLDGDVRTFFQEGSYSQNKYLILSANSLNGTFNGLTTTNLPSGFNANLSYTSTDVILNLIANMTTTSPTFQFSNQQNVLNGINNAFNNGSPLSPGFQIFVNLNPVDRDLAASQLAGEPGAGQVQAASALITSFFAYTPAFTGGVQVAAGDVNSDGIDDIIVGAGPGGGPHVQVFDGNSLNPIGASVFNPTPISQYAEPERPLPRDVADAYAAALFRKAPLATVSQSWTVWGTGLGGYNKNSGSLATGTHDTTTRTWGLAAGADRQLTRDARVGFALAGGATSWDVSQGLGTGQSNVFMAGLYGSHQFGPVYVSGALAYGFFDTTVDRTVTVAGVDRLRGTFDAHSFAGRIEAGYRFMMRYAGVTPYGAVQVQRFHTPAYAEQAVSGSAQFALAYNSQSSTSTRTELGVWLDKLTVMRDLGIAIWRGRVAWVHDDTGGGRINAVFQTLPGSNFTVNGAAGADNLALITAIAELRMRNNISIGGRLDGEFAGSTHTFVGRVTGRYQW
jgi:autotransporter-associated beta strand protein